MLTDGKSVHLFFGLEDTTPFLQVTQTTLALISVWKYEG